MVKQIDVTVTNNLELPGVAPLHKKRGRPVTGHARTTAQRQADFRCKQLEVINGSDCDWSAVQCLLVLTTPGRYPTGGIMHKSAWLQLGKLNNYC
jgi:hypothetical protein